MEAVPLADPAGYVALPVYRALLLHVALPAPLVNHPGVAEAIHEALLLGVDRVQARLATTPHAGHPSPVLILLHQGRRHARSDTILKPR